MRMTRGITGTGNLRVMAIIFPPRCAESSRGDNKGLWMLPIQFRHPPPPNVRYDRWALHLGFAEIDMSLINKLRLHFSFSF
ncbi:hypothetical protein PUN28_010543 [Cardiocondyla obscurior]|uniref:Uncharacterized protein n=1 Tax=Cardiocondyla obscurior TaxID=286306 RepID=A0AAW2FIS5_9HYME